MPRTFDCPKCGAPVNYAENPLGQGTVNCKYCSSVIAEPAMGRPAQVIQVKIGSPQGFKVPKAVWVTLLLVPIIGITIAIVAVVAGFSTAFRATRNIPTRTVEPRGSITDPKGGTQPVNGPATMLLKFGSAGIGPGMFTDARSIAVDGPGNIYVGEYSGGRIQVFDPVGKFVTQWSVDPKMPLRALAADRKGTVYVVQSGNIKKYEGSTGKMIGEIKYADGWGFDDVAVAADGGLACAWYKGHDDLVRLDSDGNVMKTIKSAISSQSGDSELNMRIAIDGMGNIYALGTFNNAVFKFGPDGKYINRFGGDGDKSGQFRAPQSIAVDGHGRVYISDMKGIQIFDGDGRYLDIFKADGTNASGMVFNDKNELFVVARDKVVKLELNVR